MTDFSVKKVSVPGRLLLLSSPQSDLCCEHALASATIAPGKRGFRSRRSTLFPCSQTSRRCSLCRAQPQLRSHMKGRGVNPLPGLRWALLSTLRPANASIGCACLEGRKKGSLVFAVAWEHHLEQPESLALHSALHGIPGTLHKRALRSRCRKWMSWWTQLWYGYL